MKKIQLLFLVFLCSFANAFELRPFISSPSTRGIMGLNIETPYFEIGVSHGSTFLYTGHGDMVIPIAINALKSFGSMRHQVFLNGSMAPAFSKSFASNNEFAFMPLQAFGLGAGYVRLFEKFGVFVELGAAWSKDYRTANFESDFQMQYILPALGVFYRL